MKKVLGIVLSLVLVAGSLVGCGGGTATTSGTTAATTGAEATTAGEAEGSAAKNVDGKKIGICIYKFDDNFMTLYRTELERYLKAGGASVTVMDGKNDQTEQQNQIDNFITQGVDLLIINLVQASAAEQIANKCSEAKVPVVFINREPDKSEQERWEKEGIAATYVGADASQSGTYQGEIILETENKGDWNGDGSIGYVMIQGDMENVDAQLRTEFSIKALTDAGMKIEKLDEQRGEWDQAKGNEIAANALTSHGDKIDVIFCNNDAMALGAAQAISAAGRTVGKDIYLVGVDALTDALTKVIAGEMTGTVFNDHFSQSQKAADVGGEMMEGKDVDVYYRVDYVKVTKDNAQEILDSLTK